MGDATSSDVRDRIMDAATKLFSEKGYAATSVREIVKLAGVTNPVLYYYFENKEGLYQKLMAETFERFLTIFSEVKNAGMGPRESLLELAKRTFAEAELNSEKMTILLSPFSRPAQGSPFFDLEPYQREIYGYLSEFIDRGVEQGIFAPGVFEPFVQAYTSVMITASQRSTSRMTVMSDANSLMATINFVVDAITVK